MSQVWSLVSVPICISTLLISVFDEVLPGTHCHVLGSSVHFSPPPKPRSDAESYASVKWNVVAGLSGTPLEASTPPRPLAPTTQSPNPPLANTSPSMAKPPDGINTGATPTG